MSLFCKRTNAGLHTFTLLHIPWIKTFVKARTGCEINNEGYKIQKTGTAQKYYADLTQKYSHVSPKLTDYTEDPTSPNYVMGYPWHDMIAILLNTNAQQNSS